LASLPDIQAMFRNASWEACHIRWLPASEGRVLGPKIIAHSMEMILLLRNVTVPPSTWNFSIPYAVDEVWDGDLTTMKFIHAKVECSSSPIFTSKDIWPNDQMVSPLNPVRCSSVHVHSVHEVPSYLSLNDHWSLRSVLVSQRMASGLSFLVVSLFLGAFGLSFYFSSLMNCDNYTLPLEHFHLSAFSTACIRPYCSSYLHGIRSICLDPFFLHGLPLVVEP
ncbi:hypothetical protein Tco_1166085, partial [Tanacetum coccineum]